jgi:hypothetical protein
MPLRLDPNFLKLAYNFIGTTARCSVSGNNSTVLTPVPVVRWCSDQGSRHEPRQAWCHLRGVSRGSASGRPTPAQRTSPLRLTLHQPTQHPVDRIRSVARCRLYGNNPHPLPWSQPFPCRAGPPSGSPTSTRPVVNRRTPAVNVAWTTKESNAANHQ